MKLVIQSIHNDLISRSPVFVTLALQCVANINSREMAESFSLDIPKLLVSRLVMNDKHGYRLKFFAFITSEYISFRKTKKI